MSTSIESKKPYLALCLLLAIALIRAGLALTNEMLWELRLGANVQPLLQFQFFTGILLFILSCLPYW